jgi:hypothetical protein
MTTDPPSPDQERGTCGDREFSGSPPRLETKQAQVLAMLARSKGVRGPKIAGATDWPPRCGCHSGLAKNGIPLDVLGRFRQVGLAEATAMSSDNLYMHV